MTTTFQRRNSTARLTAYSWGDGNGLRRPQRGKIDLTMGKDPAPFKLQTLTTTKPLGQPGTWTATLLADRNAVSLRDVVADGDWVDCVIRMADREVCVMRGPIVTRRRDIKSTGVSWEISGFDHTWIWDQAESWWNPIANENLGSGLVMATILSETRRVSQYPSGMVRIFLETLFRAMAVRGRALLEMPPGLPNATGSFLESMRYFQDFRALPPRVAFVPHATDFGGTNLWAFATEWSDPSFALLHSDLVHPTTGAPLRKTDKQGPDDVALGVIHRDRPFPTDADPNPTTQTGVLPGQASSSAWWGLETHDVEEGEILRLEDGSTAEERFNAFFAHPILGGGSNSLDTFGMLYNPTSFARFGMRRSDAESKFCSEVMNDRGLALAFRAARRDWYCLQNLFFAGSCSIAGGRPEIRCGDKFRRLTGPDQETYYIENVSHRFVAPGNTTTTLTLTRGFRGSDQDYLIALREEQRKYLDSAQVQFGTPGEADLPQIGGGIA